MRVIAVVILRDHGQCCGRQSRSRRPLQAGRPEAVKIQLQRLLQRRLTWNISENPRWASAPRRGHL